MNPEIPQDDEEEEQYLCKLFGDEGRYVNFVNQTSRPVKLTSQLQMTGYSHMSWSTNAIIQPFSSHRWRFLGDSPNLSLYFLSLLPDPYSLARRNSYIWRVTYLDSSQTNKPLINKQEGTLDLKSLTELGPGDTEIVEITAHSKGPASLQHLVSDFIANTYDLTSQQMEPLELPKTLKLSLANLIRDYEEVKNDKMIPCPKCQEKHH